MSHIGRNIKKIRSVKGLSQEQFANIINVKRASIGAYEEGRAEPKIPAIMEIANHFGISIDDLLTKELTVNDLYRFDIFRDDLQQFGANNLLPSRDVTDLLQIPFISIGEREDLLKSADVPRFLGSLPALCLPLSKGRSYIALEFGADDAPGVLGQGEIAIASSIDLDDVLNHEGRAAFLIQTEKDIGCFRVLRHRIREWRLNSYAENQVVRIVDQKLIKQAWRVESVITKNVSRHLHSGLDSYDMESRLKALEAALAKKS
ncbi:helix-turn-helix transcriptional regulator [Sanyastnella coralliicola]|uniref:helix-turn-helix transcriptional regulator n=1 Tax=Sanyastnella coralliicola TaxID=3069118 RepID=UPI0027B9E620|nr:helix-turn-helix transcriptional regulator [Longitalea sp. SCSIO 12813]